MKKVFVVLAIAAAAGAIVAIRKRGESEPKPTIWQKMQAAMEDMPEDFPPRVMFDNVEAAKENTVLILEILRERTVVAEAEPAGV